MVVKAIEAKSGDREKRYWFKVATQFSQSVIPSILPRIFFCGLFGFFISFIYSYEPSLSLPSISSVFPTIVLGLLLVFRTNTAYERFWEGRKLWGNIVNNINNCARTIWVSVAEKKPEDKEEKIKVLLLLVAFAVGTKLQLRSEPVNSELEALMPKELYEELKTANNPPLTIAFWISDYLQKQHDRNCLNAYQLTAMSQLIDTMVRAVGGCGRILKTPIPLAYSIHLKQLLILYCLTLPFQLVSDLQWWTGPITAIISFAVFGIEAIGIEIENPFGYDANDLPLDRICQTTQINIEDLMSLDPGVRHFQKTIYSDLQAN